jgi:phage gp29-like protein
MNLKSITLAARRLIRGDGVSRQAVGNVRDEFAVESMASALTRLPDPDDVLRRAGLQRHDLRRLEFDDEISGALETRREACINTPWRLEGAEGEGKDFIEKELKRVADTMLRGMWQAVPYGYSVSEAVYATREGTRVGIERVAVKPMQWFEPLRDGRLVFAPPDRGTRVEIDQAFKFLLVRRNGTYQNPFGEALLSRLYWAWYFRHTGWKAWMQFLERFGDPFVVGKSADPQEMVTALLGMGVKNVIGVGTDDELDVLMQSVPAEFERLENALGTRIQKVILGQTLTSQMSSTGGSFAAAKVHETVRQDKRHSDLRLLTPGCQWLVNALWTLNSFAGEAPVFTFEDAAGIELERAERDSILIAAGAVRVTKDYLLRAYDYQEGDIEVPDGEEEGDGTTDPKAPRGKKDDSPGARAKRIRDARVKAAEFKERRRFTPQQEAVEQLVADAMAKAPGGPLTNAQLLGAIKGARDRDELEARLALLLDAQSPGYQEIMARAVFAADVLGYVHAEEEA